VKLVLIGLLFIIGFSVPAYSKGIVCIRWTKKHRCAKFRIGPVFKKKNKNNTTVMVEVNPAPVTTEVIQEVYIEQPAPVIAPVGPTIIDAEFECTISVKIATNSTTCSWDSYTSSETFSASGDGLRTVAEELTYNAPFLADKYAKEFPVETYIGGRYVKRAYICKMSARSCSKTEIYDNGSVETSHISTAGIEAILW